jgi:hypothetical protein
LLDIGEKGALMTRHVSAIFEDHQKAADAVRSLREAGFWDREFSVLARSGDTSEGQSHESRVEEESGKGGAWTGSVLGSAVAGMAGLLSIAAIPAVPLLMVGGAAIGGTAGRVFGRLGVGQEELESMQNDLEHGGVLVVVHQETDERAALARDLLTQARGKSVRVAS